MKKEIKETMKPKKDEVKAKLKVKGSAEDVKKVLKKAIGGKNGK